MFDFNPDTHPDPKKTSEDESGSEKKSFEIRLSAPRGPLTVSSRLGESW